MILPERVLGRSGVNMICFGRAIGPISFATCCRSSLTSASVASLPPRRMTKAKIDSPLTSSGCPTTAASATARVRDQRALDLRGAQTMPRDVHDVVNAAEQPVVPLLVALAAVAGEVLAREAAPVGLLVALGIAVDAAQHRRPRLREHQVAALAKRDRIAQVIDHVGLDAGQRERRRAWLGRGQARESARSWPRRFPSATRCRRSGSGPGRCARGTRSTPRG